MADDLESLQQEIFRIHGIHVGKNDPIMIQFTLNERLLAQGAKAQEDLLEQFKSELEGVAYQWGNDAKAKAERMLNASLTASKEAMANLMRASADEAAKAMKLEFEQALRKAEGPAQSARNMTALNVAASVITLIAALLVTWSTIT